MNVIGSLAAPTDLDDLETIRDEIEGFVTSLLTLIDVRDPASPSVLREVYATGVLVESRRIDKEMLEHEWERENLLQRNDAHK